MHAVLHPTLLWGSLRLGRWSIVSWMLGVAAMAAMIVGIGATTDSEAILGLLASFPSWFIELFLPGGLDVEAQAYLIYVTLEYFSWLPIGIAFYPLFSMGAAIARDAEKGTLTPIMAQPIGRTATVLTKYAAFLAGLAAIMTGGGIGIVAMEAAVLGGRPGMSLLGNLYAHIELFAFGAAFGAIALLCSALFLDSTKTWAVGGAFLFVSYVVQLTASLDAPFDALRYLSLLYYWRPLDAVITAQLSLQTMGVYVGVAIAALVTAVAVFQRRDLSL